ncbi:MAG: EamA family transporter [Holosporaceae bacterium]|jgi:drug/metabolite transporter (DMT)-like permease|nr:EamA family transporter [Holosporaceae bacterium]
MDVRKQGYLFFILGIFCYSFSDAIIKYFMPVYGVRQVIFFRTFFRFIPFLLFALYQRVNYLKTSRVKENIFRAVLASCGSYAYMCAYNYAPMVDVFTVGLSTAIFMIPLGVFILKEKFCGRSIVATLLGFSGICLALRPGSGIFQPGIIIAAIGAFIGALNQIFIKKLTYTENELTIIFYHHSFLLTAAFFIGLPTLTPMSLNHTLLLFVGGTTAAAAQYCIIHSFKFSELMKLAPFYYVMLIPDVMFDFFLYDKPPDAYIIGGLLLILLGTLIALRVRPQEA